MEELLMLEWSYSPVDFFEEPISIIEPDYEIRIDRGRIEAILIAEYFDIHNELMELLEARIKSIFIGAELINNRQYSLSRSTESRLKSDGTTNVKASVKVFLKVAEVVTLANSVDVVITEKEGNVTTDTKQERIDHQNRLAKRISKYILIDPLLRKLLDSYKSSIDDPNNSLIHLYEIREALKNEFNGEAEARKALNVTYTKWRSFGRLADNEPIKQGRHRGQFKNLRDVTADELRAAREFAYSLIEGYLLFLESQQSTQSR